MTDLLTMIRVVDTNDKATKVCKTCGGDGIERCDNPDHGFIEIMSFDDIGRIGCPCCGYDGFFRMKTWKNGKYEWNDCLDCGGSGKIVPSHRMEKETER